MGYLRMKTIRQLCDAEEVLIGSGLVSVCAGVWMRWDLGMALTVTGVMVLGLGCWIAFGK